jgi:hypothetical protein
MRSEVQSAVDENLAGPLYNLSETWRFLINRGMQQLGQLAYNTNEIFEPGDWYPSEPDADGMGIWIDVFSPRHSVLMEQVKKHTFPRFRIAEVQVCNNVCRVHFRPPIN